jgi:hypothetical protein
MNFQAIFAVSAAGLAAVYFIRGAYRDLSAREAGSCHKCSSGGCPAASKR